MCLSGEAARAAPGADVLEHRQLGAGCVEALRVFVRLRAENGETERECCAALGEGGVRVPDHYCGEVRAGDGWRVRLLPHEVSPEVKWCEAERECQGGGRLLRPERAPRGREGREEFAACADAAGEDYRWCVAAASLAVDRGEDRQVVCW